MNPADAFNDPQSVAAYAQGPMHNVPSWAHMMWVPMPI